MSTFNCFDVAKSAVDTVPFHTINTREPIVVYHLVEGNAQFVYAIDLSVTGLCHDEMREEETPREAWKVVFK
ncbi:MAG: hypothetical protein AAFY09_09780 [Pseudomonadota bacterium]